jgi:hypothetical protein
MDEALYPQINFSCSRSRDLEDEVRALERNGVIGSEILTTGD